MGVFFNAPFSVVLFFVLSGFVISSSAARTRDRLVVNIAVRYLRLALPATASVVFAWALLTMMPHATDALARLLPHRWLSYCLQGPIPGLPAAVLHGMYGAFASGDSHFNNVLWTMRIELIGSWALYLIYRFTPIRWRIGALLLAGLLLPFAAAGGFEGFVFGAVLRELWANRSLPSASPLLPFGAGVLIGSITTANYLAVGAPRLPYILMPGSSGILYPAGAALMVYGCLVSTRLGAAFSIPPLRFLGRISFSLYLIHVPLLYTVFAVIYVAMPPVTAGSLVALLCLFLCVSIATAFVATIGVDEPVLRLNSWLRRALRPALPRPLVPSIVPAVP